MPYRTFVDSTGTEWQVWDIVPQLTERRGDGNGAIERRVQTVVIPFADRREETRRLADTRRAVLRGTYSRGWLCFQSDAGKRRLSPIPGDWTTCSDERLERYGRSAERVSGAVPIVTNYNDTIAEAG